ncbi:hypothetical protein ACTJJ0_09490 [Chitinophaga sp. 22321]|uniref:Uncharacterized protein n=1 Tax=Chitinophaga hostae TaxID=2831022 RepID=A0ABS5IS38_9BACT|nr:hypothetical protein [Chitinophaga hostae]MBS0025777.1 hypothetical protein [Chitinophaga hostae]
MKNLTGSLLVALLLFYACKPAADKKNTAPSANGDSLALGKLPGTYTGDFGGAPIYIILNYANGKNVAGYNVHKGLRRNLRGEMTKENNTWILTLSEPGDHPFDGKFILTFDEQFNNAKGSWKPLNNSTLKEKNLALHRNAENTNENYAMTGNTFNFFLIDNSDSKSDLSFNEDGSCMLQLYEKINDTTYANQMLRIRGTYQKLNDSTLSISWEKNPHFKERTNQYKILLNRDQEDGSISTNGVQIDSLEFVMGL